MLISGHRKANFSVYLLLDPSSLVESSVFPEYIVNHVVLSIDVSKYCYCYCIVLALHAVELMAVLRPAGSKWL